MTTRWLFHEGDLPSIAALEIDGVRYDRETVERIVGAHRALEHALIEMVWACENAGLRPYPAWRDARQALGSRDPLRHLCGPVDEEDGP